MDLNKVMIIGRLTRDPEVRTIPSGQNVASFSVATSRQWTDKVTSQARSVTEYHNVVAWRRLADICRQYLHKGSQVYIEGHLQTRSWDDQSGNKRYRTEIIADNMIMLGAKNNGAPSSTSIPTGNESMPPEPVIQIEEESESISSEDIPF